MKVRRMSWDECKDFGMTFWDTRTKSLFGVTIVHQVDDNGEIIDIYPARISKEDSGPMSIEDMESFGHMYKNCPEALLFLSKQLAELPIKAHVNNNGLYIELDVNNIDRDGMSKLHSLYPTRYSWQFLVTNSDTWYTVYARENTWVVQRDYKWGDAKYEVGDFLEAIDRIIELES